MKVFFFSATHLQTLTYIFTDLFIIFLYFLNLDNRENREKIEQGKHKNTRKTSKIYTFHNHNKKEVVVSFIFHGDFSELRGQAFIWYSESRHAMLSL
jgi:hypothetical protein